MDLVSLQKESDNKKLVNLILHGDRHIRFLRLVSYDYSDNDVKVVESPDQPPVPEFVDRKRYRFNVVGSCDGLVLVVVLTIEGGGYVIYIWNPVTGEYKTLPQLKSSIGENNVFGFGRDFTTDDDDVNYKVLFLETVYKIDRAEFKVNLYTTRTNSWNTELPDIPFMSSYCHLQGMILACDSLHHSAEIDDVTGVGEGDESIISFDLKDDKFRVLPVVPETLSSLCALKGDLCAFCYGADVDLYKLWKMENFGFKEQEHWTIMFSIDSRAVLDKPITFLSPLHLLEEEGQILLSARYKGEVKTFIISCHTENKKPSFLIQGSEVSFPMMSVPVLYEKKEEELPGQLKRRRV